MQTIDHVSLAEVSLIALVIGALGVATAIQAHLQQKMDSIAVIKCLGAKSSCRVMRIYVLQTAGLGLAGSILGIALGSLVEMAFPIFLARYFQIAAVPRFDMISALQGLLVGMLTVLLFTVPPLLGIQYIRPALIFRREMAMPQKAGVKRSNAAPRRNASPQMLILIFVGVLAGWLSEDARIGRYFAVAIAVGMASLAVVAWLLLRGLRWFSRHLPRSAGPRSSARASPISTAPAIMRAPR